MVTIGMNYLVLPGKEATFENAFNGVLNAMQGMPGHVQSHLFKEVANPQNYMILSDWNDKAAFDAFITSDAFRKVANWGKEQILAGRPKHEVYQK